MLRWSMFVSVTMSACLVGCGGGKPKNLPELGNVTGVIELDGKPVAGAIVMFEPKGSGALSSGGTDAAGVYSLMYRPDISGAPVGEHTVRISKRDGDAGPEVMPSHANDKSDLTATVQAGENKIDFKLKSKK